MTNSQPLIATIDGVDYRRFDCVVDLRLCLALLEPDDVPRRALSPCRPMFVIEEKPDG